jgi:flagellar basal body P-ring formation protein FlgA
MKRLLILLQIVWWNSLVAMGAMVHGITISPEVQIAESRVYLGALGKVEGFSDVFLPKLNDTLICASPAPGKSKMVLRAQIIEQLQLLGLQTEKLQLLIPEEIRITRKFQTLTPTQIAQAIERDFLHTLAWREVKLQKADCSENLILPVGKVTFEFATAPHTNYAAPFYLGISVKVDGEEIRKLFLRTTLAIHDIVPVATNAITPKDELTAENVRWETRSLTSLLHLPVLEEKQLEGKRVRMSLPAGSIICQDMLFDSPIIKRGDEVKMIYQDDKIRISTRVKSLGTGVKGEQIKVQNLDSKKEVLAEIVDNRTVRISR